MKRVVAFLLVFLAALTCAVAFDVKYHWWTETPEIRVAFHCALAGGFGGVTYCLRGVYLNACVRKNWNLDWLPWYFIRPFVSLVIGVVAYVFMRAGLIVLESGLQQGATSLGFLALAFIAGLNVDRFLDKIEDVAQATWGIRKSRTAESKPLDN